MPSLRSCLHVVWVAALAAGGCLAPSLVPCGADLCPVGSTCIADEVCASQAQLDACRGVADGDVCLLAGGVGRCDRGVCVATGCGNGVLDLGETCDDGNTTSGDGCRADCGKIEVCGDGIVDVGEGCDDANSNPADGCDACVVTTWNATALIGGHVAATETGFNQPSSVVVDRLGNVYIADRFDSFVWRVDTSGAATVLAGTGVSGFSGDGGPATSAQLATPFGVAVDGLGIVYIADTVNNRIRRVDTNGQITTVAGTGTVGALGDGGQATAAQLDAPFGVAIDGLGNLYIADRFNNRVRRVDPTGIISTFAGTGVGGASTGDGGPATAAVVSSPFGVEVDGAGNVYIAERLNNRIRRVDPSGVITTVAGTGTVGFGGDGGPASSALLNSPIGIGLDLAGNLYIADSSNNRIRRVDATTGTITSIAGTGTSGFSGDGGPATSAQLSGPFDVAVSGDGSVLIADGGNSRIRRVEPGGTIATLAGNGAAGETGDHGAATSARIGVRGLAFDGAGNLYIADDLAQRIRRVDPLGVITTVAGTGTAGFGGDGGPATEAALGQPQDVALDAAGDIYIADTFNNRIRRVTPDGVIATVAGTGVPAFGGDGGPAIAAQLRSPSAVVVDALGNLYISDSANARIRRVDPSGTITTIAGTGSSAFSGDGGPATSAGMSPIGLALDALGNLYVADRGNARVRKIDLAGVITTVAGTGSLIFGGDGGPATAASLSGPGDVAVDPAGNLYIADQQHFRVRRVDPGGVITTIAGDGTNGSSGDHGAPTTAELGLTQGIAVDGLGRVYVADAGRVRRIDATTIATVAGSVDPAGMGPIPFAHLADPRALIVTPSFLLVAGGVSGTLQGVRTGSNWLEAVAGRYPQTTATGALARFRDQSFGEVDGVAYDDARGLIYLTETSTHRIDAITIVDAADTSTWTIAPLANAAGTAGFADGAAVTAQFRNPAGLYFDPGTQDLFVADSGNHVVRAIDLSSGVAGAVVRTVAGNPTIRGFFGDGGGATSALLYGPRAVTRCPNGDLMIADTGNQRIRRVIAATGTIDSVLGDGMPASSGDGRPSRSFPVDSPQGLACDAIGNVFVTSTTTVRLLPADSGGAVDGSGSVETIYGAPPRVFPASVTRCLTGITIISPKIVQIVDACAGVLAELQRTP